MKTPKISIVSFMAALALLMSAYPACASDGTLTNIVVTPANPFIGVGSNQQFTATGRYDDGSAQVLTNGGGTGGSWSMMAGMPSASSMPACAAVDGELYVAGTFSQQVYAYNPSLNAWTNVAPFVNPWTSYSGAAAIGHKLYIMGGCEYTDCASTVPTVSVYDAVANAWSNAAPMNTPRSAMAVGMINGIIYVAGGVYQSSFLNSLEAYDPASNVWTFKTAMPTVREMASGAVINGKLYVVGGYNSTNSYLATVEVYNPATDAWTNAAPLPTPRFGVEVATVGGLLYAMGGYVNGASDPTNVVEVYDPVANTWSAGMPMLNVVYGTQQPVVLAGTIYVVGCAPYSQGVTTNMEAFTPLAGLLWSSGSPTVAAIGTNGVATGLSDGSTTITATCGSRSGSSTLTVVSSPVISLQPTNNTVSPNGSVTLNVSASGGGLSYQWQFNGTNITGATGASLAITNVSPANIGVYTVIVNNAAGSVTSTSVILTSVGIKMFAGIIVDGPLGSNYLIQATSNLLSGWTTLTNLALPSQPYIFIDYNSPANSQQFYRAVPQ
jgi:N-acetylneuraminic acid mutarotase